MPGSNLEQVGNVEEDYEHKPMTVRFHGRVTRPFLVLKLYSMFESKYITNRDTISAGASEARRALNSAIYHGEIKPLSGLGFAVLSEEGLNVARWDRERPSVLKNQIYGDGSLDITADGWGSSIIYHERNAWFRYLASERTKYYKDKYLDDVIEGQLPAKGDPNYPKRLKRIGRELREKAKLVLELVEESRAARRNSWEYHYGRGLEIESLIEMLREENPEIDFDNRMPEITRTYKPSDFQSGITVDIFENEKWNQLATQIISESQESDEWVHLDEPHIGVEYRDMIEAGHLKEANGGYYMLTPLTFERLLLKFARKEPVVHRLDKDEIERLVDRGVLR